MRRIIVYILLTSLILLSIYFAFFHKSDLNVDEFKFNSEDTSSVTKIEISDLSGKVELLKSDNQWKVNGTYHANQTMVNQLFRILTNLELDILVPENEKDSMIDYLNKKGVKLMIYNQNTVIQFWIGNYDESKQSTLIMNDKNMPAYVLAPGLTNNILKFISSDPIFWRDRTIFGLNSELISSIQLDDYRNANNSFLIEKRGEELHIFDSRRNELKSDESKLSRYLSYFNNINFNSLAEELTASQQDSLIKTEAMYSIKVIERKGWEIILKLYSRKAPGIRNEADLNNAYAVINNEKPVLVISYFQIDPILKEINYFK